MYFTNFGDIGAMALALALQENSPLLNLEMGYCCSYVGIMKIFNALSHNTTLTKLVAYGTYEDLLGAPVGMLLSFGVLSELNLQASHINDEAMFVFASGLKSHITLTKLNLGDNCFTKLGARLLADALEVNTSLQTLILFGTESALVSTCLRLNSSLTVLNLGFANTPIGDLPAKEKSPEALVNLSDSEKIPFCREAFWMFIQMSCLSSIFLEDNNLEDEGAKALATVLSKNETLTACDIASNNIGPLGIAALSSVLALEKCRLVSFKLSDNFAGDDGAASLAESLGVNTSLTLLDLSDTEIGDLGAQSLAQSLIHNSSLRALSLVKNAIGKTGAEELLSLVSANTSLTNLKLNPEEISEVIVKEIGIFAQSNKELLRNREQTSLKVLCEEMLRMR
jgi:Ran GTPase-activating protein (RanGAP) involved in mRNA processing and transport